MTIDYPAVGIARVPIPVPLPVETTNCYVLDSGDGLVIIDAGMDTPEARDAWDGAIRQLHLRETPVRGIFVTHFHPDHLGLAAWLSDRLEAPVRMIQGETETARQYLRPWTDGDWDQFRSFYTMHGLSREQTRAWWDLEQVFRHGLTMPAHVDPIHAGRTECLGGLRMAFLEQGGHTEHQGLVWLPERRILFTGDQVLARITPNVSVWPQSGANPLNEYLQSLHRLKALNAGLALPAHEAQIDHLNARIDVLFEHHRQRNERVLQLLTPGGQTGLELTHQLFDRPLHDYQLRFALGETLAHVEYLRHLGAVRVSDHVPRRLWLSEGGSRETLGHV